MWIAKPTGRSQGKGIFLFSNIKNVQEYAPDRKWKDERFKGDSTTIAEAYILQRYITNPYLIGGKKFDLRLYALTLSYMPLTAWLYRGGFARFSFTRWVSLPKCVSVKTCDNGRVRATGTAQS